MNFQIVYIIRYVTCIQCAAPARAGEDEKRVWMSGPVSM